MNSNFVMFSTHKSMLKETIMMKSCDILPWHSNHVSFVHCYLLLRDNHGTRKVWDLAWSLLAPHRFSFKPFTTAKAAIALYESYWKELTAWFFLSQIITPIALRLGIHLALAFSQESSSESQHPALSQRVLFWLLWLEQHSPGWSWRVDRRGRDSLSTTAPHGLQRMFIILSLHFLKKKE